MNEDKRSSVGDVQNRFEEFYKEYKDYIQKIDFNNLTVEAIQDMIDQVDGWANHLNQPSVAKGISEKNKRDNEKKISAMKENLEEIKKISEENAVAASEPEEVIVSEFRVDEVFEAEGFPVPKSNTFTELLSVINSFDFDGKLDHSKVQKLKQAIDEVKKDASYNFVKNGNGGSKEEQLAVAMIDRLDKILKFAERRKRPGLSFIVQNAVKIMLYSMKEIEDFNAGMVRLAKKSKPTVTAEFKEESHDTIKLGKEDFRAVVDFIERVDRLRKGAAGPPSLKLSPAVEIQYEQFKKDFNKFNTIFKKVGGEVSLQRDYWNKIISNIQPVSKNVALLHPIDVALKTISDRGADCSMSETGKNILRNRIDIIKTSPEYLEYQQAKRNGAEETHARHQTFLAIDQCEKLLNKAIRTQNIPLISQRNNMALKTFFEETKTKPQTPLSPRV